MNHTPGEPRQEQPSAAAAITAAAKRLAAAAQRLLAVLLGRAGVVRQRADAGLAAANPDWWERAIAGICSHGGHGWDGDVCTDAPPGWGTVLAGELVEEDQ
jgi:hypothetical protein